MCGTAVGRSKGGRVFGVDAARASTGLRVGVALSVLVPVVLSGLFLVVFAPGLWWVFTTYGWLAFPALSLLFTPAAGGRAEAVAAVSAGTSGERELLEALREGGELTAVGVAAGTSLSVSEADRRLRELAGEGHLEVRVRGGGLFYSLWDAGGPEG